MRSLDRPRVILPAAGFGRRMGSPKAKELLPLRNGNPLINQALEMSLLRAWPVTLITRPEKEVLINHVKGFEEKSLSLSVCITGKTMEWPDSILKSEGHWNEWNLVVLPDTEFLPVNIWDQMWEATDEDTDLVVAEHAVEDSAQWGVLKSTENGVTVGEKQSGEKKAWGLFMFRRKWGEKILKAQLESQQTSKWVELEGCRQKSLSLDLFQDLTRGK